MNYDIFLNIFSLVTKMQSVVVLCLNRFFSQIIIFNIFPVLVLTLPQVFFVTDHTEVFRSSKRSDVH